MSRQHSYRPEDQMSKVYIRSDSEFMLISNRQSGYGCLFLKKKWSLIEIFTRISTKATICIAPWNFLIGREMNRQAPVILQNSLFYKYKWIPMCSSIDSPTWTWCTLYAEHRASSEDLHPLQKLIVPAELKDSGRCSGIWHKTIRNSSAAAVPGLHVRCQV